MQKNKRQQQAHSAITQYRFLHARTLALASFERDVLACFLETNFSGIHRISCCDCCSSKWLSRIIHHSNDSTHIFRTFLQWCLKNHVTSSRTRVRSDLFHNVPYIFSPYLLISSQFFESLQNIIFSSAYHAFSLIRLEDVSKYPIVCSFRP